MGMKCCFDAVLGVVTGNEDIVFGSFLIAHDRAQKPVINLRS